ncbi:cytochrome P450 [Ornithinibacillus sp. L9]|uniref:Cytochrome P450 n=2 Tax=Ornithinibacillus caprae TaxID=2678566 RepID=A0A6N8FJG3_9BACI|nr:cytochrome P450 [Ornithinibacillus caprae]
MPYREQIPIDKGLDNSLSLMMEGYRYISNRREKFGRDIFETRLLGGQKAICIAGKDAAEVFYDEEKFIRQGAAPKRVRQTIFGEKAIQTMDGASHEHRKAVFMSLMSRESLEEVVHITRDEYDQFISRWEGMDRVVLFEESKELLTRVACRWAGVPLQEEEVKIRTNQLAALFDSAAAVGPRHWRGRQARNSSESWIKGMIEQIRAGNMETQEGTALHELAWYRDSNGKLLNSQVTAVEVINILRPIVAIAVYIAFCALAIHDFPEQAGKLTSKDDSYDEMFVQEVRRYYPFFPFAAARVKKDFLWKGHDFKKGNLVLLDIYGTNHHRDIWERPWEFNPKRFADRKDDPFDFIPQGGGDYHKGHRCPGEWLTIEVMKVSVDTFVRKMYYDMPKQDLNYSMMRMPSLPKSRVILTNIKRKL